MVYFILKNLIANVIKDDDDVTLLIIVPIFDINVIKIYKALKTNNNL